MKLLQLVAISLAMLISTVALADECTATCDSEYADCKNVAESGTAKQACEDDLKQCKADCQ
ncbi:MAG TPA: hypothetical protein PKZ68_09215 [Pseudomonadales bacterium]|jgi:hypothetical protein|nr:hypothetical protein [Pseudomonadales bacterium]HNI38463.1 hypothetical protein [Pseudomonadales bacterium]HNL92552.1 hypothetical protein [Pseudomonadales bacterium]